MADAQDAGTYFLDAGTLEARNGSVAFDHLFPYDAHDPLSALWRTGDAIALAASGGIVPAFSTMVAFPSRVDFLEPDLRSPTIVLSTEGTFELKWTPVQGSGTVEVTGASIEWPDANWRSEVVRCTAPVDQGTMTVPPFSMGGFNLWRGIAVRVLNRATVQVSGLTVDAIVASFDSGRIDVTLPPPDAGSATDGSDGSAADGP